ncbi:MAG TPA: RraA family protein [Chloroflexota bacterium]|nr:RraA family protein [Chloroflexota bacterium]
MSDSLVAHLAKLDSCAVSDALDRLGLPGATMGLQRMWDCPRLVGRVITVKLKPFVQGETSSRHLGTAAIEAARPGEIIVVDNGGRTYAGSWGGILSVAAKYKGVAGVVADGACRDVDEARDLQFPVYARAGVSITARGRIVEESFNQPIEIAGVAVQPGDLVIADWTGVVFVPSTRAEEVIVQAEEIAAREAAMAEAVRAGKPASEVMGATYERMTGR